MVAGMLLCAASAPLAAQEVLVDLGAQWTFFRGTEAPSQPDVTAWRSEAFDATAWETGPAGIGYGDGDDATVLDDMQDSYLTVYLRRTFDVADAAALNSLLLTIAYDDGFVAYINGVEVARSQAGAPGTELAFDDPADAAHEADDLEFFDLTPSLGVLRDGENLLAVEVHNVNLGSSDLSFDARLSGNDPRIDCASNLVCTKTATSVTLSWDVGPVIYDSIAVTRDGIPLAGSPFPGDATSVVDDAPGDFVHDYEVVFTIDGVACAPLMCSVTPDLNLVSVGDEWRFFRGLTAPSDPPEAWRASDFDDSAWEIGPTGIGYDDGDDATVLDDMEGSYVSVFLRTTFSIADPGVFSNLSLSVDYDDGFIAYLNGVEIARSANMGAPGTEVAFDQTADAGHEANGAEPFDVSAAIDDLVVGANVLAIQVHNVTVDSSDLSMLPELIANSCEFDLVCLYDPAEDSVTLNVEGLTADSITVLRNGLPLAGSPFPGDMTTIVDENPIAVDNLYEVIPSLAGVECASQLCQLSCSTREPDALTCQLDLVAGATQATLSWAPRPQAVAIEVLREGTFLATLDPGETSFVDPDVEAEEPEDDTDFDVVFTFADDTTCTIECNESLCAQDLVCEVIDDAGTPRARLSWDNMVKSWESVTIELDGVPLVEGLPGDTTSFVDTTSPLQIGAPRTYTVIPVAPPGEEVTCPTLSCTVARQIEETASYEAPAGGWDYRADFDAGEAQYNPVAGESGNLDGNRIRALDLDSWDGSAPAEIGVAPDGAAPGGVAVETVAAGSECGETASVLRLLDPGDPTNPGGSLAMEYPEAYSEPNNRTIFLGFDLGVADRNVLRDGVTFAARWRIGPNSPSYLDANPTGDGSPITGGVGQVGLYFVDDGTLGLAGAPAALSFSLQSNQDLQMSTEPLSTFGGVDLLSFRTLWVTVVDPEGDDLYNVNLYLNGDTQPLASFGTGIDLPLQSATVDIGAPVANLLGISLPTGGNDADVQVDWIAYKEGVHVPSSTPCVPVEGPRFRRGDGDGNGVIELTDPIQNLTFQFLGGFVPPCIDALDFDDNGILELTDPIQNLTFQFLGGPGPQPPGAATCGVDPTEDSPAVGGELGCEAYPPQSCN